MSKVFLVKLGVWTMFSEINAHNISDSRDKLLVSFLFSETVILVSKCKDQITWKKYSTSVGTVQCTVHRYKKLNILFENALKS